MNDETNGGSAKKHLAAFFGAAGCSYVLAGLVWVLFSEPCQLGVTSLSVDCIQAGGAQLSLEAVVIVATIVAFVGGLIFDGST